MSLDAPVMQPESRGVPPTAGIGKSIDPEPAAAAPAPVAAVTKATLEKELTERIHNGEISIDDARTALGLAPFGLPETSGPVAAFKAPAQDEFVDEAVYKGFKKMRKRLGKKVLAGEMTVDEARAKMGRQFAQKATEPEPVTDDLVKAVAQGSMSSPVRS